MPLKADFSAALKINEILPVALVLIGAPLVAAAPSVQDIDETEPVSYAGKAHTILFGHGAVSGLRMERNLISLDAGCVCGREFYCGSPGISQGFSGSMCLISTASMCAIVCSARRASSRRFWL